MEALIEIENDIITMSFEMKVPDSIHFDIFKDFMIDHWYWIFMGSLHPDNETKIYRLIRSIEWILTWDSAIKQEARDKHIKVTLLDN